ncbi:MAG: DUF190 domain-containing protein [Chlamydiales bacterium]
MKGICLKFYAYEFQKQHGILLYEWLLELARKEGIHGGTAFRGISGFGRHGNLHEERFFELAGNVPVEVSFIVNEEEAKHFLNLLKNEKLDLFYVKFPVEHGELTEKE